MFMCISVNLPLLDNIFNHCGLYTKFRLRGGLSRVCVRVFVSALLCNGISHLRGVSFDR